MEREYTVTKMVTPGAIITLRRPVLTEEERARRMKGVHDAACRLVLETERLRRQKELASAAGE